VGGEGRRQEGGEKCFGGRDHEHGQGKADLQLGSGRWTGGWRADVVLPCGSGMLVERGAFGGGKGGKRGVGPIKQPERWRGNQQSDDKER